MKYEKDWIGGYNNYSKLEELSYNLQNLDKKFLKNLEQENSQNTIRKSLEKIISNDFNNDYDY